jgi:two-component system nitrate/nitrite response regulator NarL
MNTTKHFFLSSNARAPNPRWQEVFTLGEVVGPTALTGPIAPLQPGTYIVWLTTEDPQWRALLTQCIKAQAGTRVVLLSGSPESNEGLAALDAGAVGYTHSYALPEVLREVATVVEHGGLWVGPDLLKRLISSTSVALARLPQPSNGLGVIAQNYAKAWANLSTREAQVAQCVAQGKSNLEVAEQLFISERTVKAHMGAAFEKLGVRDRLQLAVAVAAIGASAHTSKVGLA